jgi:hypothetical protein
LLHDGLAFTQVDRYFFTRLQRTVDAMMLMVAAETLVVKSTLLWLMLPLTVFYLGALVGPLEARQLVKDFGPEYEAYAVQVPKWFPRRARKMAGHIG